MLAVPFAKISDPRRYVHADRLPYRLVSFQGRKIDLSKPVQVYRNLRRKGLPFSIRQGGKVVAHAEVLMLQDASFFVSPSGRKRVFESGHKNVHAWIRGLLVGSGMGVTAEDQENLPARIRYNPKEYGHFVGTLNGSVPFLVTRALVVKIQPGNITAAYVS